MRKLALAAILGALLGAGAAQAQDKLTLQLKWVTQSQFMSYYAAQAKGFFYGLEGQRAGLQSRRFPFTEYPRLRP